MVSIKIPLVIVLSLICMSHSFQIEVQVQDYPYPWPITVVHEPTQIIVTQMTTTTQCWKKNTTAKWWVKMLVLDDEYYWQGPANFTNTNGKVYTSAFHIESVSSPINKTYKRGDYIQFAFSAVLGTRSGIQALDFTSKGPAQQTRDTGYVKVQWATPPYCSTPGQQQYQGQQVGEHFQKQLTR